MAKKRGRPPEITEEIRQDIIIYIELHPDKTMIDVALKFMISLATLYRILPENLKSQKRFQKSNM